MLRLILILACLSAPLAGAEDADSRIQWSAEAELGYGYDSNVALDDVDFNTSAGDQFADLRLSGGLKVETERQVSATVDLTVSEKRYNSFDEFNGRLGLLSAGLERSYEHVSAGIDARYIDYRLDGEAFLDIWQIAPHLGFFPSQRTYLRVTWEYSDESFGDSPERDNQEHRLSLLGYYFVSGLRQHFTLRLQFAESDADNALFDLSSRDIRLTYNHELAGGARFRVGYRYQWRDYDEVPQPLTGRYREDRRQRIELSFSQPITKQLSVVFEAFSNDFGSNLDSADYDQQIYQLSLKYKR